MAKQHHENATALVRSVFANKAMEPERVRATVPAFVQGDGAFSQFMARLGAGFNNAAKGQPKLLECTSASLVEAARLAALVALVPNEGSIPRAHLVPYWNKDLGSYECQFAASVWGLMDLARRGGHVRDINTAAVHAFDLQEPNEYELIKEGPNRGVIHRVRTFDRGPVVGYYATIILDGDPRPLPEQMSVTDVQYIRQTCAKAPDSPAWTKHFDEMARKVVLRRLLKYAPWAPDDLSRLGAMDAHEYLLERQAEAAQRPALRPPRAINAASQPVPDSDRPESEPGPESPPDDGEPPPLTLDSFGAHKRAVGYWVMERCGSTRSGDIARWLDQQDPMAREQIIEQALAFEAEKQALAAEQEAVY